MTTASEMLERNTAPTGNQALNLQRIKEFFDLWDARPLAVNELANYFALNYVDHNRSGSDPAVSDRDGLLGTTVALAQGFSDSRHEIILLDAVGDDKVLVYWKFTGVHSGELFGIPATGRKVDFMGTDLFTLVDGKITEQRHIQELHKMFAQLNPPA
jgi:predicted ester cyclase